MPRASQEIANLLSGEVTPALKGRTDVEQYPQFLQAAENVYVEKHGGVVRRGGTKFVHESSGNKVRLVPFVFARTQSYVMEFGDRIAYLYQNDNYVPNIGNVAIYIGDGTTKKFQYPYGLTIENTIATAGQTVFPYTFEVEAGGFGVAEEGIRLEETTDYTHNSGAKTITLVVPATAGDVIQVFTNAIDENDIDVSVNDEPQTVDVDYTITPINTVANLFSPFGTPAWDGDATSIGTSWILPNDGTALSPEGAEPLLRETGVGLTHGSAVDVKVTIDSLRYTSHTHPESNPSDIPLISGGGEITIETVTINADDLYLNEVSASFTIEDVSGNRTSDFSWEILQSGVVEVVAEGVELAVTGPLQINVPITSLKQAVSLGDTITLRVSAVGNHGQSLPQISGTVNPTVLTGIGVANGDPWLHIQAASSSKQSSWDIELKDLTLPYEYVFVQDQDVLGPQPIQLEFFTDPGAVVELDNIFGRNSRDGWEIEFTTAPPQGASILIRAPESVVGTNPVGNINNPNTVDIFSFQTPFHDEELDALYWAQANDIMWFCHEDHKPWRLTRQDAYTWVWDQPTLYGTPWDLPATSWQADGTAVDYEFYFSAISKDVMEVYFNGEVQDAAIWDLKTGQTFPVTNNGTITFDEAPPLGTTVLIASTVSDYDHVDGYPRCVVYFQERLWFAATVALPQTIWGSRAADFLDFAVKGNKQVLQPDDAVEYTIAAYTHESVEWLSSERVLVIGTSSTEHRLAPDEYIATDRLPRVSKMTDYGGSHQMPMYMGGLTCFIQQSGRQLRSFQQRSNMTVEEYESVELTWMANHMVKNMWIKEPYYALVPNNIAVMVREDGQLMTAMYDPSTGQMDAKDSGWSRQITDGTFESVCVIPTDFGHQVWVAVKRTIDGVEKTYTEYFTSDFFMDSAMYTPIGAAPTDTLTNLDHLEGKTIDILVDGAVHPQRVVENGEVTLAWSGTDIVVGLHYRPKIVTMPFTDGNPQGTGQGKPGRWTEIWVRLIDSAIPLVNGKRAPVRHPTTPMGISEPNINGASRVFDTGYSFDKQITIEQDLPLGFQLVNIYGTFTIGTG